MPFEIVRNDITKMRVDAIVNSANPRPIVGLGTDSSIHQAAGPKLLLARQKIGSIAPGNAAVTPAFRLDAKYVIHTVGPVWRDGSFGENQLLRNCYDNSLKLALENRCQSIAFPLIATNNYGFPKETALQIAVSAFSAFLMEHEMTIYLVVFDQSAFRLSEKLFHSITSYIDQHYVDAWEKATYRPERNAKSQIIRRRRDMDFAAEHCAVEEALPCAPISYAAASLSLDEFLKKKDTGFTEKLLSLIQEKGLKNSTVYKRANISKQHFSKLIHDPDAKPSKPTAIALALALELDLEATRDLISRAGYALTNSSTFDLIIRYFIEHKQFNVIEINIALYEFDQTLLGA